MFLLATFALPFAASAAESSTVNEELNLRSGPGISYRVLAVMPAGSTVSVTGEASEGWYPVQYSSLSGWAFGQYLSIAGGDRSSPPAGRAAPPASAPTSSTCAADPAWPIQSSRA